MPDTALDDLAALSPIPGTAIAYFVSGGVDYQGTVTNLFVDRTLVAPLLGTPASGVLTNCTGLPLSTGVTGDLPFANLVQASAVSKLVGRGSAGGAGDFQEITLGTNLSMSGTTLNASGGGGSGDVVGPSSATDNAVVRFDSTTGKLVQDSVVTIADTTGDISTPGFFATGVGGSDAGALELIQGTAPSLGTTSVKVYAPASVTSYGIVLPGSSTTGFVKGTNSSNINTFSFVSAINLASDVTGNLPVSNLNSGTSASSSTFWRGDGTWATPAGSGTINSGATNAIPKYTASTTIDDSLLSDDATTLTYTGTGGITLTGGSGAGALELGQGTAPSAGTTSIKFYAPASVTSYIRTFPGAAGTGFYLGTNSSGVVTDTQVASTGSGDVVRATSATITTPTISGAITFPDNVRQTFNPGANAAGLNVGAIAGDPDTPSNGDLWYDSTANELTARINGSNVALGAGGGGSQTPWTGTIDADGFDLTDAGNLIPRTTKDLGAAATAWRDLYLYGGGTFGSHSLKLTGTPTGNRTITLPDSNTTVPIVSQQITWSGPSAARTYTLPDANATLARTDAANTFTGVQTFSSAPLMSTLTSGRVVFATTSGGLTDDSDMTFATDTLTVTKAILPGATSLLLGTAGSNVGDIGFRNATSGTITLAPVTGALGTVTLSLPAATDTLVGKATTDTLTNKRITARTTTVASTTTSVTIDVSTTDMHITTAQAGALLFNNPSGTPTEGQKLMIRITDNGTARALTYDTQFRASSDLALPTTTVISKTLYMGFIWNATNSKWDLLAVMNNFT